MNPTEPNNPDKARPANKANMDAPQEEFIAPQSMPSRPMPPHSGKRDDREHGDEVEGAKARNTDAGHTHSGR